MAAYPIIGAGSYFGYKKLDEYGNPVDPYAHPPNQPSPLFGPSVLKQPGAYAEGVRQQREQAQVRQNISDSRKALLYAPYSEDMTYSRAYNEGRWAKSGSPAGEAYRRAEFPAPGGEAVNQKKLARLYQLQQERERRMYANDSYVDIPPSPEEEQLMKEVWFSGEGALFRKATPQEIATGVAAPNGEADGYMWHYPVVRATPPPGWDYPGSDFQYSKNNPDPRPWENYPTPIGQTYPDVQQPRNPFQPLFTPGPPPRPTSKQTVKATAKKKKSIIPEPNYPTAKKKAKPIMRSKNRNEE